MTRPQLRFEVDLPALSPAQAHLLWRFFEELAQQIWEAYEAELFDFESQIYSSRQLDPSDEDAAPPTIAPSACPRGTDDDASDSDF